jgi:hypothetical protein
MEKQKGDLYKAIKTQKKVGSIRTSLLELLDDVLNSQEVDSLTYDRRIRLLRLRSYIDMHTKDL